MVTLISAFDKNYLIGNGNDLPWYIPEDLKFFKKTTIDQVIIMGKNTWRGLNKILLPQRFNLVVSSDADRLFEETFNTRSAVFGPIFFKEVEEAIKFGKSIGEEHGGKEKEIFIIGGRKIYEYSLQNNLIDRMLITHIEGNYFGDIYFPEIDWKEWNGREILKSKEITIKEYTRNG